MTIIYSCLVSVFVLFLHQMQLLYLDANLLEIIVLGCEFAGDYCTWMQICWRLLYLDENLLEIIVLGCKFAGDYCTWMQICWRLLYLDANLLEIIVLG